MTEILQALKREGYDTVPEEFYTHIDEWEQWYGGKLKSFHEYTIWNGSNNIHCERYSMGMAKKVAEDWANLLLNEKVKITLEGEKEQAFIDDVFKSNCFWERANELQELKAATGTAAFVPRVTNVQADAAGNVSGGEIAIDYVYGGHIIPLSWENREVSECAFASQIVSENENYIYLAIHEKGENGDYIIRNKLYKAAKGSKETAVHEVPLSELEAFENVAEVVETHSPEKQFFIDRLNIVNNVDPTLPMGVAAYANAIDQLKACDIAYDSYVNEFVLGKKRVMVKLSATKDFDGQPYFDPKDTAYYWLPEDSTDGNTIKEISMELRASQHNAGIQDMLNMLSSKCGFGEKHYKFDSGSIATATQIVSENSTLFRAIKKHEIPLERTLIGLCECLLRLGNQYMNAGLNEDVEISVDFDDSIIEDKQTEFQRDMTYLQMGLMQPYEARMKWFNEDEETAKAALPQMNAMLGGTPLPDEE